MPRFFRTLAHPFECSKTRTISSHLAMFQDRSTVPWSPCGAHGRARLPDPPSRMSSAYEARDCASSLTDGHSVLVFRRSPRARLLGACARVRLATLAFTSAFGSCRRPSSRFRAKTSLGILLCVHDQELLAALTFPCLPCSPFDQHGQHFIGSQSTGSRIRVTFRREPATIVFLLKIAPSPRTRQITPAFAFRLRRLPCRTAPRFVPAFQRSRPAAAAR